MSRTITVSDDLYQRLEATARLSGLEGIEQLLHQWESSEEERHKRIRAVRDIDALRSRLFQKYGVMPDSTTMIEEDRSR